MTKGQTTSTMTIRIPDEMIRKIKALAVNAGEPFTAYTSRILREALEAEVSGFSDEYEVFVRKIEEKEEEDRREREKIMKKEKSEV